MSAVNCIIDCYFRHVKGCFTTTDVRIQQQAFCRSAALLAYNVKTKEQFHVENAVTHSQLWPFSADNLYELFDKNFRGLPRKREGKETNNTKNKSYFKNILKTYQSLGFSSSKIKRIFVVWSMKPGVNAKAASDAYYKKHHIQVEVLSFRDRILPDLTKKVSGSFYQEEEALRMLSLFAQREIQTKKEVRSQTASSIGS